ncbi:ribosome maturation factor RimM [Flocculibacter collagenilyticus]|uniref:ribosome maturation factor RimM n=1 Tax=Flocculibacter collagenilyticus TaxID=2744479 RepID=UPI0018F7CE5B|nr:ribosome maturation factor RimM [Flocculibacter collagenilyticus]
MTINTDNSGDKIILGKLGAPYGIKGWLKVTSYTDDPEGIFSYNPWLINKEGAWQSLEIVDWRRHNKSLIVRLSNVEDRDQAQAMTHVEIAVDADALPELEGNDFYWKDLIGMNVVNEKGYNMGSVIDLMETGANDVLVVKANRQDAFGQKERLLPFLMDDVIKNVDREEKQILVDWDPGF